ncbi:tRNA preQ1(34) S-adenosylmethionine ribosyltransferase-isomerase QueA [Aeoliella sp. ICT_H6.2]|uniref:S-adenosylmethionine:tRNA ribosyltransferase-isomerase n=1 Tax=Aeoliella straminimaris TaxID=2954799 RepID=A0A9X2F8S3_9BACT|nr:tRNA preQ1(34) S-adenosylmethionine ribosyltransferase-isomerase QueA [Aeoliella straminimaris]MCO6044447.1 tRNA preQ1(34) S-adenosylmethionine ribosyltransferase-isomerase QueA [Aeoliella straminimaris]
MPLIPTNHHKMSPDPFFDYHLPRELIAQEPLRNRADARMMVVDRQRQKITHWHVRDLPELLRSGDSLVLNNTKVIPAQLFGRRKTTGGQWHGLFLRESEDGHWRIVCKTRGRLAPGDAIDLLDREGREAATLWLLDRLEGGQWLAHLDSEGTTEELLIKVGRVPLPHYIRGGRMVDADVKNYQTVFASQPGAVAAPTAGLHFTEELLRQSKQRGVEFAQVTLHVGLGTFRPITVERPEEHQMHSEWGEITEATAESLNATREKGGRIVAVGTTAVRVLESAAAAAPAGKTLAGWCGDTDLFIHPPYEFRAVDTLMTNFHFPRTTLLLLVQAFAGTELVREAYAEAVREEYRFYSYGDAMLVI